MHTTRNKTTVSKCDLSSHLNTFLCEMRDTGKIINFCFYGSFNDRTPLCISAIPDLDFILLFNEINQKNLSLIEKIKSEAISFLGAEFNVIAGYYYGAYKPIPANDKFNVFLHINAHTHETLENRHVFFKWGISIFMDSSKKQSFKLNKLSRPTIVDFINVSAGAPLYLKDAIKEGIKIPYRPPPHYNKSEVLIEDKLQLAEFCIFSVKISIINFLFTQNIDLKNVFSYEVNNSAKYCTEIERLIKECKHVPTRSNLDIEAIKYWATMSLDKIMLIANSCKN